MSYCCVFFYADNTFGSVNRKDVVVRSGYGPGETVDVKWKSHTGNSYFLGKILKVGDKKQMTEFVGFCAARYKENNEELEVLLTKLIATPDENREETPEELNENPGKRKRKLTFKMAESVAQDKQEDLVRENDQISTNDVEATKSKRPIQPSTTTAGSKVASKKQKRALVPPQKSVEGTDKEKQKAISAKKRKEMMKKAEEYTGAELGRNLNIPGGFAIQFSNKAEQPQREENPLQQKQHVISQAKLVSTERVAKLSNKVTSPTNPHKNFSQLEQQQKQQHVSFMQVSRHVQEIPTELLQAPLSASQTPIQPYYVNYTQGSQPQEVLTPLSTNQTPTQPYHVNYTQGSQPREVLTSLSTNQTPTQPYHVNFTQGSQPQEALTSLSTNQTPTRPYHGNYRQGTQSQEVLTQSSTSQTPIHPYYLNHPQGTQVQQLSTERLVQTPNEHQQNISPLNISTNEQKAIAQPSTSEHNQTFSTLLFKTNEHSDIDPEEILSDLGSEGASSRETEGQDLKAENQKLKEKVANLEKEITALRESGECSSRDATAMVSVPRPVIAWMHNVIQNAIASDDDTSYTINANLEPAKSTYLAKTRLLKEADVLVDREELRRVLSKAQHLGEAGGAKKLLNGVIRLVFTKEELAHSCGKGLKGLKGLEGKKKPLDATRCIICEDYLRSWCQEHNQRTPTEKEINGCYTNQITYAREKLGLLKSSQARKKGPNES